ncbi:putative MMPL domain protein [metagenome]|uniref:Putative MMPL domain protein n=1 Tax=metagenome TaxID=256318 RepID=A0A2P2C7G0_9ZZZZ
MLLRLADMCFRHRRLVVVGWVAALFAAFALAGALGGEFKQDYLQPGSESQRVAHTLQDRFPQRSGDTMQVIVHSPAGVTSVDVEARVESILADVAAAQHVVDVTSPFSPDGAHQISADGTTAYADVALDATADELTPDEASALVAPILAAADDTLQVEVGGPVATKSQTVAAGSEGIGLIAAAVILLITFGSVVAMGLPLITALFGLGIAMALGEVLRRIVDVPDWAPYTAAMVGIGVGIDYALLIVTRFRGSLADGQDPRGATQTAIATAGRAVLFAGLTVVISMLGILLMGQPAMNGFAFTVVLAVLVTMAASVTLLPALLGFTGRNIERLHVPFVSRNVRAYDASRWYRWSRFVQRSPWWAALGSLTVLIALAAPFAGIRFGFPDAGNSSPTLTTRQAYDLLTDGFGPGYSAPMVLTVQGTPQTDLLGSADAVAATLRTVDGVELVSPAILNPAGDTAVITLTAATSPQDQATQDLVHLLRDEAIPAATTGTGLTVDLGGTVPANVDSTQGVASRLPLFFGGVLLMSFLLLMMVFRSVLVPVKAVLMNLLASAGAFGVLALAVSGGRLGDWVGIPEATPVPIQLPIGIFAILFGLSMDYEVFLLSRIKEEYDRTADNALAVADGLARSARVITAGAAIMVTVFVSFVLGHDVMAKMFGIGLAAAVLIDATLIRMVLVPATMELLGERNWWLPTWLDRLLPRIHIDGGSDWTPDLSTPVLVDPVTSSQERISAGWRSQ